MKTTITNTKKIAWLGMLTGVLFTLVSTRSMAQCATDQVWLQALATHPGMQQKADEFYASTQQYIKNYETQRTLGSTDTITYIIPLVFHILHQYGPENIPDEQIFDEMRILNKDYAKLNPDTTEIATPHFKHIAANTKIQFRLAQIDPNGKPTNGIDRIYTYLTNNAGNSSKIGQWDPSKYMNVWVVKNISLNSGVPTGGTVLGFAIFPVEAAFEPSLDGVMINYQAIGSVGAANTVPPLWDRCLTHELGHTLSLEHPWGITNSPGVKCGGCGISDIPTTEGYFSICPLDTNDAKHCDTVSTSPLFIATENWQNFMDYSFCSVMFTQGQAEAMWAVLNSNTAGRNNLWSAANLAATGVSPTLANIQEDSSAIESSCAPIADFYNPGNPYNTCMVCQGSSVSFQDASYNTEPKSWAWTFTGATTATATSKKQNPSATFDSLWWQSVTLTATNAVGSSTKTKRFVYVSPLWPQYTGPFSEGFEDPSTFSWIILNNANDLSNWHITSTASYSGQNSLMLNSYQPGVYNTNTVPEQVIIPPVGAGATDDAITPAVAFNYLSTATLSFQYACATSSDNFAGISESLTVAYSLNCGKSWFVVKTLSDTALVTAGQWSTAYVPSSASQWKFASVQLPNAQFHGQGNVRFRFEYTSGVSSNNLYIDNIVLAGTLGTQDISVQDNGFTVYPNPASASTNVTVSYNLNSNENVKVVVSDILGKDVKEVANEQQSQGLHTLNFNGSGLSQGIYFVKLITDDGIVAAKKLVIIK